MTKDAISKTLKFTKYLNDTYIAFFMRLNSLETKEYILIFPCYSLFFLSDGQ